MNLLKQKGLLTIGLATLCGLAPSLALADELNVGDTAWVLTSTVLVLFMTIPGLALFYGGLVRSKNVLSVLMQCFAITCMVSVLWLVFVYGLAFGDGGDMNRWIGGFDQMMLSTIGRDTLSGTIPESVFAMFQMTFAIITPALIVGAFAERMKFSAMLWFSAFWLVLVYAPVTHWVWGGGWLCGAGAWTTQGFWQDGDAAAQPHHDGNRCRHVVGRLVRL
jgi:Amt family ammonium transporter